MNLLKIAKIIQRYKQLRIQELKTKIKLQKNFTDIHQDINRLKRILPKIEIPKILQKEEPQPPKEIVETKEIVKKNFENVFDLINGDFNKDILSQKQFKNIVKIQNV